ncbi:dioxygenase, partial [Streptomyces sp. NPDC002812]
MTDHQNDSTAGRSGPAHKAPVFTRRKAIVIGGGGAIGGAAALAVPGLLLQGAMAGGTTTASDASDSLCVLTVEQTEGPYYIDADKIRSNITEDREGVPLRVRVKIVDAATCKPLPGAAVDIWHCDAMGEYSGFVGASGGGAGGGTGGGEPPTGAPTGAPTGEPPTG